MTDGRVLAALRLHSSTPSGIGVDRRAALAPERALDAIALADREAIPALLAVEFGLLRTGESGCLESGSGTCRSSGTMLSAPPVESFGDGTVRR
jgi:hypothetical protein